MRKALTAVGLVLVAATLVRGEKEIEPARLVSTMTTLPGSIWQGEKEVARAVLRFHLRDDLLRFMRSFKRR